MNPRTLQKVHQINNARIFSQSTRAKARQRFNEPIMARPKQVLATIESIATGTPKHVVRQIDASQVVANLPTLEQNRSRIEKIYSNTRIETRHLALNLLSPEAIEFSEKGKIQDRMKMYQEYGIPLAEQVAKQALQAASANLANITDSIRLIVFVSSTGFIAPGVDAELIKRLGLRRDTSRVTVNFMGCAAAMNGLRVASDHVRANPTHKALVVCLELSSVNAVFEDKMNDVIIHSIFGDGCAAVVVGACEETQAIGQGKIVIRDHLSYLVENTEDGIVLGIQDNGITCQLSRQLPDYIESGVNPIIEQFLTSHQLTKESIDLWAVHPGGTRIIEKAQRSLGLSDRQVADSWDILRQYGNMLSVSILFVLKQMLLRCENTLPDSNAQNSALAQRPLTGMAFSFSPGVGIEGILFEKL